MHKFQVGQSVELIPRVVRQAAEGCYEILRLMPAGDDDPRYCVKSTAERHQRIVPECDLKLAQNPASALP